MVHTGSVEPDTMARKAAAAPQPDPRHVRLKRVVDARKGYRTYTEIAEAAGMDKRVLSRILNGSVPDPRISTIEAILHAVGADLCDLEQA